MTLLGDDVVRPEVEGRVGADEWAVRVDLAACYRLVHHFGMTDLIYNHISAQVPGPDGHFLLNAYGLLYDEVCASNLVKVDLEGNVVDDPLGWGINRAGFVIHGAIHQARPDAACVLHTHTRAGIAVSAQRHGLLPINQQAMWFYNRIGYHDFEGVVLELDERVRLIEHLGDFDALILRNHGLLTLGPTVADAFQLMWFLEQSCRAQVDALAGGVALVVPADEVAERSAQQFRRPGREANEKQWTASRRLLDRTDPSYRR